mgnify:CR=1 FL=1
MLLYLTVKVPVFSKYIAYIVELLVNVLVYVVSVDVYDVLMLVLQPLKVYPLMVGLVRDALLPLVTVDVLLLLHVSCVFVVEYAFPVRVYCAAFPVTLPSVTIQLPLTPADVADVLAVPEYVPFALKFTLPLSTLHQPFWFLAKPVKEVEGADPSAVR